MTIGIDTSRTTKERLTGTEYYSVEIIKALSRLDLDNQYILYAQKDPSARLGQLGDNFSTKIMPFPKFWSQIRLSLEMIKKSPDVLFVPSHTVPIIHPKNTVVTLHDLGFKHFPELYSPTELFYHNWGMNFAANHAVEIIAPSEFTKKDLIKTYGIEPSRIHVVWHGFDKDLFKPNKNIKRKPYILFIGRLEEKKNILGMIRAYALLRKEKRITHQLVLAGAPGFGYENIVKEIESLPKNIAQDIVLTGYISQAEYIRRLQEAEIFLFTTFFEGFGMPLVEAMACETPIVASNTTSMPEIAGNAALFVDPNKPLEIAAALSKLINSEKLRSELSYRGRMRARQFSWDRAGRETLEVLKKANKN